MLNHLCKGSLFMKMKKHLHKRIWIFETFFSQLCDVFSFEFVLAVGSFDHKIYI
jgi:hypothetical protein